MKNPLGSARSRAKFFFHENPVFCGVFFFLLLTGVAAGMNILFKLPGIADIIGDTPYRLRAEGASFAHCVLISLCAHGMTAVMLLLPGVCLPAAPLWPAAILLRGVMTGAALGAAARALPDAAGIYLLILLTIETAVMLPVLIRLAVISKNQMNAGLRRLFQPERTAHGAQSLPPPCFKVCAGLLPAIALECAAAPLVLYIFC